MSRSFHPARAALLALAALGACERESPPTSPSAAVVTAPSAGSCSFSNLKQAASRYFSNKTTDPIYQVTDQQAAYNLIQAMSQATDPTRTDRGYDLLALAARVTNTARQIGTADQGSATVYNTLLCTKYASEAGSATTFGDALKVKGIFGVRGGDAAASPIDPATAPVVAKRTTGSSLTWGIEPPLAGATAVRWSALTQLGQLPHRVLIYSATTSATFQNTLFTGTQAIELKTIPAAATFAPYAVIGYCVEGNGRGLIEHKTPASEIIPYVEPRFCTVAFDSSLGLLPRERTPLALARALVGWGAALLRPTPARAMFNPGAVGGGKGSVSPFAVVDGGTLLIAFSTQPQDATTTTELKEFAVRLTTSSTPATPVVGAPITVSVTGNSGSFTLFEGGVAVPGAAVTETTDGNGIAHFSVAPDTLRLDKPGGYTLTARIAPNTPQYSGYQPPPVAASTLFHITQ